MSDRELGTSRSWFCVFNNPEEHGYVGTPEEIVDKLIEAWIDKNPQRSCAVNYCISADGLKHCHAVFEDTKPMRFSTIKNTFPSMHIEPTKGSKEQAEDYINKRGVWEEKGEKIICVNRHGEIKGCQGARKDVEIIEEMLLQGMTPNEIMDVSFAYRKWDKHIREAYFRKRYKETPIIRKIKVYWHVGYSGTGKSYEYAMLAEEHGEENVYLVSEYDFGFDKYNGEPVLFMDEFRGQMKYNQVLAILDERKSQIRCRYLNCICLWNEIHITSVLPPEEVYNKMVQEHKAYDGIEQLIRRINFIVYHFKDGDEFCKHEIPMTEYKDYNTLKDSSKESSPKCIRELQETEGYQLPF